MKALAIIFLSVFLSKGCDDQAGNEMKKSTIEYQALSRGFFLNISIQDDKLAITDKRDAAARIYELTDKDWKELAGLYKNVQIEKLASYKDPTQKRFYDGAPIATLKILYEGKSYETVGFDHGDPPLEIAAFVNKIVSFAKIKTNDN